jgi:hypothetical protein
MVSLLSAAIACVADRMMSHKLKWGEQGKWSPIIISILTKHSVKGAVQSMDGGLEDIGTAGDGLPPTILTSRVDGLSHHIIMQWGRVCVCGTSQHAIHRQAAFN